MTNSELYKLLDFPAEVVTKLNEYEHERTFNCPEQLKQKILCRTTWDEGIKELQALLDNDTQGFKILWELLHLVCTFSYENYLKHNISQEIFVATMKFCTRFLNEHYRTYGTYKYVWAWWFPRQISLQEFRIGALEYEFVEGDGFKEISVHIPSDAEFTKESVLKSVNEFKAFCKLYFPDWQDVKMVCDTWMLAPAMEELLSEGSNILSFKRMFELEQIDLEATWFMGWIYPGFDGPLETLPENTSLQKNMKKYLLSGKKVGVAKGVWKNV